MKKGFTLIELLAVIVILAIIAVIAVPIVIDIIEDTKINSVKTSANMYLKAAELYISNVELNKVKIETGTYPITEEGNICIGIIEENKCNGEVIKIDVKGSKPTNGQIIIDEKGNIEIDYLEISGYVYYNDNDNYIVEKATEESFNSDNGTITLNSSKIPYLTNYRIYGTNSGVGNQVTEEGDNEGKYKIPIKVAGKNLFDFNGNEVLYKAPYGSIEKLENGYKAVCTNSAGSYRIDVLIPMSLLEVGKTYSVNAVMSNVIQIIVGEANDSDDTSSFKKFGVYQNNYATFTISEITKPYLNLYFYSKTYEVGDFIQIENIQLEEGTSATSYEPYKEEIYSIYLDEPLRCLGEICDYIDYESRKVIRYIEQIDSTGTKSIEENFEVLTMPIIEKIELPKIKIKEGVSNIFIETNIKPSKVSVNYYK